MAAPKALSWERALQMRRKIANEAVRLGLTAIEVLEVQDGPGAGFLANTLIVEELARAGMGLAVSLIDTQKFTARIGRRGSAAQIARHLAKLVDGKRMGGTSLTDLGVGRDFPAITTTARKIKAAGYSTARKRGSLTPTFAEASLLYARTDAAPGTKGFAAFLIEAAPNQEKRTLLMTQVNGD